MIAFDFPPYESSGVERTFKFARYLRQFGWQPIMLTVNIDTYDPRLVSLETDYSDIKVYRTFCLDVSKHLAYKGKYFGWMKQPDRYIGWLMTAFPKGLKLLKQYKPDLIWSTHPVMTSHLIAGLLSKWTDTPWIADYRDPLQCYYDDSVYQQSGFARVIDRFTVKHASRLVFATEGTKALYQRTHSKAATEKFLTVLNGFDLNNSKDIVGKPIDERYTLFHAGSLYENGRSPLPLFQAIATLKASGEINADNFAFKLYGFHNQQKHQGICDQLNISDVIFFYDQVAYREALSLMYSSDMLIVVQGGIFDNQIPGKTYEYLSTNKPICALTPTSSNTAELLLAIEGCYASESSEDIVEFLKSEMNTRVSYSRKPELYDRVTRTKELADIFNTAISCKENY